MGKDIILYEKVNEEHLNEVLNCGNLITGDDHIWFKQFQTQLLRYSRQKPTKHGRKIVYKQNGYGRHTAVCLQGFQKDVRKYISGEYYEDVDIVNAHPVFLEQLFEKYNLNPPKFLVEYVKDREATIKKYKLQDKLSVIKLINNENSYSKYKDIKILHDSIYNKNQLLDKLKQEFKHIYKSCEKKKENINGSFICTILQKIENEILMVSYEYLIGLGFKIGTLIFDGFHIEKNELINEDLFKKLSEEVLLKTGYKVKYTFKSLKTDWKPIKNEETCILKIIKGIIDKDFGEKFSKSIAKSFFNDDKAPKLLDGRYADFIKYMNRFLCQFDNPNSYGFRNYENMKFDFRSLNTLRERIGVNIINTWNMSDDLLNFIKPDFIVEEFNDKRYYNMYKRPEMKEPTKNIKIMCPLYFKFISEIVCNGDTNLEEWIHNYTSQLIQIGRTFHCLVLMGIKGLGKSKYMWILSKLVGKEYSIPLNDINKLTNHFNKYLENNILINIEEVCPNAGEYIKVQNILKTLITETEMQITPKGLDSYTIKSYTNPIISTNFDNPVQATNDNRRFVFCGFSNKRCKDTIFFEALIKEINDNICYLRYYYYNRSYKDLAKTRPITETERAVIDINMSITERFITTVFNPNENEFDESRLYKNFLQQYNIYCDENKEKALIPRYLTPALKKLGFETQIHKHKIYIKGTSLIKCKINLDLEQNEESSIDMSVNSEFD